MAASSNRVAPDGAPTPGPRLGEPVSPATARGLGAGGATPAVGSCGSAFLVNDRSALAGVARASPGGAAGHHDRLAPEGVATLLALEEPRLTPGPRTDRPRHPGTHRPDRGGESDLGRAAHRGRAGGAGLSRQRGDCAAAPPGRLRLGSPPASLVSATSDRENGGCFAPPVFSVRQIESEKPLASSSASSPPPPRGPP